MDGFHADHRTKSGRKGACKECRNGDNRHTYATDPAFRARKLELGRIWEKENPEKAAARVKRRDRKKMRVIERRYDNSPHGRKVRAEGNRSRKNMLDVQEMPTESLVEACGGVCEMPGCGAIPKQLVRDHDHETGLTRGMLCNRCNVQLGKNGDGRVQDLDKLTPEQLEYVSNPPVYRKG